MSMGRGWSAKYWNHGAYHYCFRAGIKANLDEMKRQADEARFELVKSYVLFFTTLFVLLTLGAVCLYEAIWDQSASPETRRLAWTLLASLFTGSVSFVLGQKSAKTK